jgi:hypothetical protein
MPNRYGRHTRQSSEKIKLINGLQQYSVELRPIITEFFLKSWKITVPRQWKMKIWFAPSFLIKCPGCLNDAPSSYSQVVSREIFK